MGRIANFVNKIGYALSKNKKYEAWSQKVWDKYGSKLSPTYKKIQKWNLTKEQNAALAALLTAMPKATQTLLVTFVDKLWAFALKHYDKNMLANWLEQAIEFIQKTISGLRKN